MASETAVPPPVPPTAAAVAATPAAGAGAGAGAGAPLDAAATLGAEAQKTRWGPVCTSKTCAALFPFSHVVGWGCNTCNAFRLSPSPPALLPLSS
jgi:hypothetical protein